MMVVGARAPGRHQGLLLGRHTTLALALGPANLTTTATTSSTTCCALLACGRGCGEHVGGAAKACACRTTLCEQVR